ncbi:MAG: PilZ domain-containing protein [Desulfobacterota bacterium]|nr:PilZ domain-containing protein [Thermodesulfobacteriota bacterium]
MEKDAVYSMRMSSKIRDALRRAAKKERRTVASLLDKVITDFLQKEGLFPGPELGGERRRFPRKKITLPATTIHGAGKKAETYPGVILDISRGGILVTYAKGSEIQFTSRGELPRFRVCFQAPQSRKEIHFDCIARHMRDTGEAIQVGANFSDPNEKDLQRLAPYLM